ncbi:MAG: NAD(P)/FAD-dependent oxidoreductase [Gammaproteobacteria bacterium]|nr:NAD(P)/FAD-dependent oxidoreductase [Gammaproteobacteria bacterium]MBQ0838258.1 NAD(P)/FAD-dependent oxidoreductase [Gammaproteobacteria bacterium]
MSTTKTASGCVLADQRKFSDFPDTSPVAEKLASGKLGFDPDQLRAKYASERDKRIRPEGQGQYQDMSGELDIFINDPFVKPGFEREAVERDVDVLIVGGGFGGLLGAAHLREAGVKDICIIEKAGDFGGTWYWNRYPGAQCDVESYLYLPLLEKLGYMPKEKYSFGPEILDHSLAIAKKYDLYDGALLQTGVTDMSWDEGSQRWVVTTDRGDVLKARFISLATGILAKPKLPRIAGITDFKGHVFHTSRWDFDYTKGSTAGDLTGLKDKRVGIIGTGPTALQCIPHLGKDSKELFVFQRTPSAIDVRGNHATNPRWVDSLKPGWQARRMKNFNIITNGGYQEEDLVNDGWTDLFRGLVGSEGKSEAQKSMSAEEREAIKEIAHFQKMEEVRDRVDAIVVDKDTAENLKAYYRPFCKRPCFHDDYLKTFNRPNVTLVDTDGKGVEVITEKGVVIAGVEYELDCLIVATGFETGEGFTSASGFEINGRDGSKLSEKWADGPSTMHGMFSHGFPNCFFMGLFQTGLTVSLPHTLNEQAEHIAYVVGQSKERGLDVVEVSQQRQDDWGATIRSKAHNNEEFFNTCTPGYYNNEGKGGFNGHNFLTNQYGGGPIEFFEILKNWREEGGMQGLETT